MTGGDRTQKQLWKLIQKGQLDKVEDFIASMAHNDAATLLEKHHKASGDSPIHLACRHGFLSIVKYFHETWDIGLEMRNLDDKRPLHESAAAGHLDVVRYLLDNGVAVDALKRSDWTPLMLACTKYSNLPVIKLLLHHGANINLVNKDGWNCFHIACREGDLSIVKHFLGIEPILWKTTSNNGRTPLHTATMHGQESVLKFLIEKCDFSLNVQDSCGSSPLMEAVKGGHMHLVILLVDSGADINMVDNLGRSVLHVAAECNRTKAIEYLVKDCQMDPNSRTEPCDSAISGHTALDWAYKEHQLNAVSLLKALGAKDIDR